MDHEPPPLTRAALLRSSAPVSSSSSSLLPPRDQQKGGWADEGVGGDDLVMQVVSWHAVDEAVDDGEDDDDDGEEEGEKSGGDGGKGRALGEFGAEARASRYVIRAFGVTRAGRSVALTIRGYTPFFYVKVPAEAPWGGRGASSAARAGLVRAVEEAGRALGANGVKLFNKVDFWGFTNGAMAPFLRVSFGSLKGMRMMAGSLRKRPVRVPGIAQQASLALYEDNIDPLLRFFHIRELVPAGWVRVAAADVRPLRGSTASTCQRDLECDWTRVCVDRSLANDTAPFVVASFDIECNSSHGDFPVAIKDYSKLALDLRHAWEHGGIRELGTAEAGHAAKVALVDCMRRAFGMPTACCDEEEGGASAEAGPAATGKGEPQKKKRPPPRVGRVFTKVAPLPPADLDRIERLLQRHVDTVYDILRGAMPGTRTAGGAAAGGRGAGRGAGGWSKAGAVGGGRGGRGGDGGRGEEDGGDDEAAEDGGPLARLAGVLNSMFNKRYPVRGDEVIQIGTTVHLYGDRDCRARCVYTLGGCQPFGDGDVIVRSFDSEADMLLAWVELMRAIDPDVITGYNINGFDQAYLYNRACDLLGGVEACEARFCRLGRLEGVPSKYVEQQLSSSALGDNLLRYLDMHGRVLVDIMKVVQRDHKLDSYKLDHVAGHFMGLHKNDVSPNDIFRLQRGSDADRAVIAEYCVQDCALCNQLLMKLEIMANNIGMANVCSVPLSFIFMRGQGVKIFSLVASQCRADGFVVPARRLAEGAAAEEDSYEGAIVLEPQSGMYLDVPVSVLDYNSLYPSSMISENLSHDSIVLDPRYDDLPGVEYVTITYDILHEGEKVGEQRCRFAQPNASNGRRAVLPRILEHLLRQRKLTRKRMTHRAAVRASTGETLAVGAWDEAARTLTPEATAASTPPFTLPAPGSEGHDPDVELRPAHNPFQLAVLDGLQNAFKVTANSLYGQMGARTSPLYLKQVAACTTAVGRMMILKAKEYVESEAVGGRVIYGDSVVGATPVLVRTTHGGAPSSVSYERIDRLASKLGGGAWRPLRADAKEACELVGVEVWSDAGWTAVSRVIRHALAPHKRVVCVATPHGIVHVTDDHSLLRADGAPVACAHLVPGDALLHAPVSLALPAAGAAALPDNDGRKHVLSAPENADALWQAIGLARALGAMLGERHARARRRCKAIRGDDNGCDDDGCDYDGVPACVLSSPHHDVRVAFWRGLVASPACVRYGQSGLVTVALTSMLAGAGVYAIAQAVEPTRSVTLCKLDGDAVAVYVGQTVVEGDEGVAGRRSGRIVEMRPCCEGGGEHVYDLTTESSHFSAGAGDLVVHNTDSIFVVFKHPQMHDPMHPRSTQSDAPEAAGAAAGAIEGVKAKKGAAIVNKTHANYRELLASSIRQGQAASRGIAPLLRAPHNLEYEKTMFPFVLLSKKRYVGLLYEDDPDATPKQKSMGIVLKRRDNAPIVKTIYGGIIDIILKQRNVRAAVEFLRVSLKDLVEGRVSVDELVITKALRGHYKNPTQIAHWVLAQRMYERDPGSAPQVNDRIPYVFVEPTAAAMQRARASTSAQMLQGDRIEHVQHVRDKGLRPDVKFYITNQITKPIVQLLALALEQLQGYKVNAAVSGPRALADLVAAKNGDRDKAKERLATLREREVEALLFKPALAHPNIRQSDNRRTGQREIDALLRPRKGLL